MIKPDLSHTYSMPLRYIIQIMVFEMMNRKLVKAAQIILRIWIKDMIVSKKTRGQRKAKNNGKCVRGPD